MRFFPLMMVIAVGCSASAPPPKEIPPAVKIDIPGIENAFQLSDKLYSGGEPAGDAAFEELKKRGVTTVISVDGKAPDAATAQKFGMKTVHLPVGYHGIDTLTIHKIAKAIKDSNGAVFVHCHHGQHRGPTAVAVARLCLEPDYTPAAAIAWMTLAGCDEKYKGLWAMPGSVERPGAEAIDGITDELPARAKVNDLAAYMVRIDQDYDALMRAKGKDWLGAENAATLMAEDFREAQRTLIGTGKGESFLSMMHAAEKNADQIARSVKDNDFKTAGELLARSRQHCLQCHAQFRD